jgi:hypothetical protein
MHENFFDLKTLAGSFASTFSKTTGNETVNMTDIKTVTVDKRSPSEHLLSEKLQKKL